MRQLFREISYRSYLIVLMIGVGLSNMLSCVGHAEELNRGMLAVPYETEKIYLSWRLLEDDDSDVAFNVYRSSGGGTETKLNTNPIEAATCFIDSSNPPVNQVNSYWVRPVVDGVELDASEQASVPANWGVVSYKSISLNNTDETPKKIGIADLNGDKAYDYVVKWPNYNVDPYYPEPSPDTFKLHGYLADGTFLWEYDLGWSIEMGTWYSPYVVYDFDGDGKAEVALKTGEGDPRDADGRVTSGNEYLSILDGTTGTVITQADWLSRDGFDSYNTYSRNHIGVGYLNGRDNNPSIVIVRGTYNLIKVMVYQYSNQTLSLQWTWSSTGLYNRQGAHTFSCVGVDVDEDGKDEIILGSCALDDDGSELWTTGLGHCDHFYVGDIDPNHAGLEIYYGIEHAKSQYGSCLVDADTGEIIWGISEATYHVHGSGLCSDIDSANEGMECYSKERDYTTAWLHSADGTLLADENTLDWGDTLKAVYWDADPQRELIDSSTTAGIYNYPAWNTPIDYIRGNLLGLADILGDWREEVLTGMPGEIRIYTTTIPASGSHVCLMQDPIYKNTVNHFSMGYIRAPMVTECLTLRQGQNSQWNLDEGTGTDVTDSSEAGNDGIIINGAAWDDGISGYSLYFDGDNDYVKLPAATINPDEGSFELWFNRESIIAGEGNYIFAHCETANNSRIYLSYAVDSSLLYFKLANGATIGTCTTELNKWYHVAGVWKGTTAWFYVNGELINPGGKTFNGLTATTNITLGGLYSNQSFNGRIDEVKIYTHALTDVEVKDSYNQTAINGNWNFDEGIGTKVMDSSDKRNDGTITNGAAWDEGLCGNSLYFDGSNDYVSLPSSTINPDEGSFELCFNRESIIAGEGNYILAHCETASSSRIYLNYLIDSSTLALRLGNGTSIGSCTAETDKWYHVAGVWQGTTAWFYVNGELINEGGTTFNGLTATTDVILGGLYNNQSFNGRIDEVKIYNHALSASAVTASYERVMLSGQWNFEEGSGTEVYDSSGKANFGDVYGESVWDEGISDSALYFDGIDDSVKLPSTVIIPGEGSFELWFKREAIVYGEGNYIFSHSETANNSRIYLGFLTDSNILKLKMGTGSTIGSYTTELDTWYHVVGTWKGTTGWLYVNGELISTGGTTFNGLVARTTVWLGSMSGGGSQFFNGAIDELKIYNHALTDAEVSARYSAYTE